MYIIIAIGLVILTLFLINSKLFDELRARKTRSFEFFISLISTFIGFFIALSLNTILSDINQKKNLVKVLDATNLSLENSEMKTQGMYLNAAKKGADISEIIQYAPMEIPKLYSNLETNSLVSDYFLSNAFQAYILCNDNLQTFVKSANASNVTSEKKVLILEKYLAYLNLAKQINTLEIKRLNGDISLSDEDQELQKLIQQIKNN
ncbi:hypothetical protein ACFOWU_00180 [Epilithonimonas zeae]|uniref:Uncharacterized protein n=1 Tax=Epilithonimonas zeae TaxID=1416779 RepID=A0A1N6DTL7_9FLAO|nr:hypothetical protein [Epilithonimonas zeae]SIN74126.1 hypothetical protein SAMN05444409_0039 [Epilithonimonas zeae]